MDFLRWLFRPAPRPDFQKIKAQLSASIYYDYVEGSAIFVKSYGTAQQVRIAHDFLAELVRETGGESSGELLCQLSWSMLEKREKEEYTPEQLELLERIFRRWHDLAALETEFSFFYTSATGIWLAKTPEAEFVDAVREFGEVVVGMEQWILYSQMGFVGYREG